MQIHIRKNMRGRIFLRGIAVDLKNQWKAPTKIKKLLQELYIRQQYYVYNNWTFKERLASHALY